MASSSDKFIKTVQAPPSKLAGPIGPDTETIPLQTLEGWSSTTAVVVAIDRYDDATGEITPSKTEIVVGTLGPNGLENVERGVGGTRQNHSDGAVAEISIAAGEQWNRAMDALIGALGQDGKIKGEMIVPGSVGPGAFNEATIPGMRYQKTVQLSSNISTISIADAPASVSMFKIYICGSRNLNNSDLLEFGVIGKTMNKISLVGDGSTTWSSVSNNVNDIIGRNVGGYDFMLEALINRKEWVSAQARMTVDNRILESNATATNGNSWDKFFLRSSNATLNGTMTVVGM